MKRMMQAETHGQLEGAVDGPAVPKTPPQADRPEAAQRDAPVPAATVGQGERATTFQPVEGGGETRSGELLLVEAYAVLWLLLMGWLVLLWRKQNTLRTRLDDLERAIDQAAAKQSK
jgi:hypothetical protein